MRSAPLSTDASAPGNGGAAAGGARRSRRGSAARVRRFSLLGLELAAIAVTVAAVALAPGPGWRQRGEAWRALWAGGIALALIAAGLGVVVPRLAILANG